MRTPSRPATDATNDPVELFGATSLPLPRVLAAVAFGGAVGATGRWAVGELFPAEPGVWPWATLLVNVLGALAIGFAARGVERDSLRWALLVTGVLGGFTTFSALAVELNDMVEAERTTIAVAYGAVTLAAGVAATLVAGLGRAAGRRRSGNATDTSGGGRP